MSNATVGLIVPLEVKEGQSQAVAEFLGKGRKLVEAEPETLQWYAVKLSDSKYAVFDTFAGESGRAAHLSGQVAAKLKEHTSALFASDPCIAPVEILASVVRPESASIQATVGLYVPLVAKPEHAEEVKEFLISIVPLVEAEPETLQWCAYRKSETEFGILDTAAGESEREAHLKGKVAEILKGKKDLLVSRPNIQKCDILAAKVVV